MKHTVEVTILNQRFTLRSDADKEYVQEVAKTLNEKIQEISSTTKSVSSLSLAILAALNMTDELLKIKNQQKIFRDHFQKKVENILKQVHLRLELIEQK